MDTQDDQVTDVAPVDRRVVALANRQHGVFSRDQLIDELVSPHQIRSRIRTGRWEPVLPQVYRIAGGVPTARQAAMAAALWGGTEALVSHCTAAHLWRFEHVRAGAMEIWVPKGGRKATSQVRAHRGVRLDRADRTTVDGIPVTTPTRTLIDVAGRLEDDALAAELDGLLRRGLVTCERLDARLRALRASGRPGGGRLAALLEARGDDPGTLESRLEAKVWQLLLRSGLPHPRRQHWVVAHGRRYRLDFAWPDRRVAVECDGWQFHGGRRRFELDRQRDADLASIHWCIVPVTWRQCVQDPAVVLTRIVTAVAHVA